jgi:site-specific recombinase XerD
LINSLFTRANVIARLNESPHLCNHRRASPQTIASYRDTFRLLLQFLKTTTGIEPVAMTVFDIDVPAILAFLDSLEMKRGNSVRTRNIRLAAIRSFFRLVALRDPDSVGLATRILAIPVKRENKKLVAIHLLQSGVDISVIALWLGHESIETTHIYLQADLKTKERLWPGWCRPKGPFRDSSPQTHCLHFLTRSDSST